MGSFLVKLTEKNVFWFWIVDSRAHSYPCYPVLPRIQLTVTYWHKNLSSEHMPTIEVDRCDPISTTLRVACSLCTGYPIWSHIWSAIDRYPSIMMNASKLDSVEVFYYDLASNMTFVYKYSCIKISPWHWNL